MPKKAGKRKNAESEMAATEIPPLLQALQAINPAGNADLVELDDYIDLVQSKTCTVPVMKALLIEENNPEPGKLFVAKKLSQKSATENLVLWLNKLFSTEKDDSGRAAKTSKGSAELKKSLDEVKEQIQAAQSALEDQEDDEEDESDAEVASDSAELLKNQELLFEIASQRQILKNLRDQLSARTASKGTPKSASVWGRKKEHIS